MDWFNVDPLIFTDGCLSETLLIFSGTSITITWPEVGIGENVQVSCPCGNIVSLSPLFNL